MKEKKERKKERKKQRKKEGMKERKKEKQGSKEGQQNQKRSFFVNKIFEQFKLQNLKITMEIQ
jgi:hypothetical protein